MEQLTPQRFTPFPKNPVIARVFKEIGRADELGSGVRNIFKYYKYYSDIKPKLEENDVFNCFVYTDKIEENRNVVEDVTVKVANKVTDKVTNKVANKVTDKVTNNQNIIIQLILENNKVSTSEMAEKIGISKRKVLEKTSAVKYSLTTAADGKNTTLHS
jgi:ATP-dependent DNA helicase RecG